MSTALHPTAPAPYELFAIKYATRGGSRSEFFLAHDAHDEPMALNYYLWLARRPGHVCLIDTGFNEATARKKGRALLRDPIDSLRLLGTGAAEVQDVVLTHLHYDHAGNFDRLPCARFHVQDLEMQYATGRYMAHKICGRPYEPEHIGRLVQEVFDGKVKFHNGDSHVSDGVTLHHVGGHTMGLQFVRVYTARGWVVLASDASIFYEGYQCCAPAKQVFHVGDMIRGYERLRALAQDGSSIVPGHDPAVMSHYPPPSPALEGIAVRLDVAPNTQA